MTALMDNAKQAIPVTDVSRSAKKIVDQLASGEQDKFVVMRNNIPAAVLMSVAHYENLLEIIEDLKLDLLAQKRLETSVTEDFISHQEMKKKFGL
jgi:antitoxin StbD